MGSRLDSFINWHQMWLNCTVARYCWSDVISQPSWHVCIDPLLIVPALCLHPALLFMCVYLRLLSGLVLLSCLIQYPSIINTMQAHAFNFPSNCNQMTPLNLDLLCSSLGDVHYSDNGPTGYNSWGSSCFTLLGSDFYINNHNLTFQLQHALLLIPPMLFCSFHPSLVSLQTMYRHCIISTRHLLTWHGWLRLLTISGMCISYMILCKKESQVKSKKTAFSQEKSRKSQKILTFCWLFLTKSCFWLYLTFFFTEHDWSSSTDASSHHQWDNPPQCYRGWFVSCQKPCIYVHIQGEYQSHWSDRGSWVHMLHNSSLIYVDYCSYRKVCVTFSLALGALCQVSKKIIQDTTPEKQELHPKVIYWQKHMYLDERYRQDELAKQGIEPPHRGWRPKVDSKTKNVSFWHLQRDNGVVLMGDKEKQIWAEAKKMWRTLCNTYGPIRSPWTSIALKHQLEFYIDTEAMYPLLRLCENHDKAETICYSDYHWMEIMLLLLTKSWHIYDKRQLKFLQFVCHKI